ncbi:PREDICTED: olfactory receptor 2V2-like, partial [Galeopterus variegatus]|uniref:Olfactory receptor 2V2-like n=1 Tax=Galeopterus variegatus TaxID=482537 RepID=A0ABM0SJX4_GALVR
QPHSDPFWERSSHRPHRRLISLDPRLHTPTPFFLSRLSLMSLMLVCANVPKVAGNFLSGRTSICFGGCGMHIGLFVCLVGSEGLLLGLVAYDRSVDISHPLHYPILVNQGICLQIAGSSWTSGIIDGLIQTVVVMTFPCCGLREVNHFFCEVLSLLKLACVDTSLFEKVVFVCCVFMLLFPFSIIMASYSRILGTVLRMCSAQAHKKALATCSPHLTAVSLFYGAAMFIYLRPRCYRAPSHDKVVSVFCTVLTPMLNPLIYSLRNHEVMGSLRKGLDHCRTGSRH